MERSMYTDHERRLTSERNKKYRGIALINLSQIVPHNSICRALDPRNVERLCGVFSKEGCRRLDVPNHVTAVVSSHSLDSALQNARVSAAQLMSDTSDGYPHLQFPSGQVKCLHGQHRLKAGEEFLADCDQWWTVNLYLDDISPTLQATLVDEYCNEKTPTDGEIYRKIRQYQHETNAHFEKRWKARLTPNKLKRFQQLESHDDVRAAVNSLLALPALLEHGMKLCSISRALAIGCDEELVNGLNDVYEYWSSLVKHKRSKMLKIDPHSIQSLQLLAPGVSNKDRKLAKGLVLGGEAFSAFASAERTSIWKLMKSRKRIIPSLYTFFRNVWYLESCANCLKRIVSLNKKQPTIKRAVRNAFLKPPSEGGDCLIQVSETKFRPYKSHEADRAELAYRQLWLYAMRHYLKMAKEPENQDDVVKAWEKADPRILYDLAVLARRLGFRSDQIKSLLTQSPDRQIAREALWKARDHEQYKYDNDVFDSLVDRVAECFQQASPLGCEPERGLIDDRETQIRLRCGYPQVKAQRQDRWFLFVDQLHTSWPSTTKKVSTLFVRQCVYHTFFNELPFSSPSVTDGHSMSPLFVAEELSEQVPRCRKEEMPSRKAYRKPSNLKKRRKEKGHGRHRQERKRHERQEKKRMKEHEKGRKRRHEKGRKRRNEHMSQNHQSPRSRYSQLEWCASDSSARRICSIRDDSSGMDRSSTSREEEGYRIGFGEHSQQGSELGTGDEQMENIQSQSLATTVAEQNIAAEHSWELTYQREEEMTADKIFEDAVVENTGEPESAELATQQTIALPGHGPSRTDSRRPGRRDDNRWSPYHVVQRRKRESSSVCERPQDALERQIGKLLQPSDPTRPVTQIDFSEMPSEPPQAIQDQEESGLADREYCSTSMERQSPWDTTVTTSAEIFDPGRGDSQEFLEPMVNGTIHSAHVVKSSTFQTTTENTLADQGDPAEDARTNLSENSTCAPTSCQNPTESFSRPSIKIEPHSKRDGVIFAQTAPERPSTGDVPESAPPETETTLVETRAGQGHERLAAPTPTNPNGQTLERQEEQPLTSENGRATRYNSRDGERQRDDITPALDAPTRRRSQTPPHIVTSGPSEQRGTKRGLWQRYGHRPVHEVKKPRAITQIDFTNSNGVATSERKSGDPDEANATQQESLTLARLHETNQSTRPNNLDQNDSEKTTSARAEQSEPQNLDSEQQRGGSHKIRIIFRGRDNRGGWDHVIQQMTVDPTDPVPVELFAREKAKEQVPATFYDQNLRTIVPAQCFDSAVQDGTNTIFVAFGPELARNKDNMDSVSRALAEGRGQHRRPKRRMM